MNNLLSYCGLVDAKIRASDKELTVQAQKVKLTHSKIQSSWDFENERLSYEKALR